MPENLEHESDIVSKALPFLRSLLVLLVVEAAAVAGFALLVLWELLFRGSASTPTAIFLIVVLSGGAWILVAAGFALLRQRRVSRGLIITWQLFQILTGLMAALGSEASWAVYGGWTAVLVAVAVIVLMMLPPVIETTTRTTVQEE